MINFNIPPFTGKETEYMAKAIQNHKISGDGEFTKKCNKWIEDHTGTAKALLTTSCTHATEMAALLADIKPGDEVIMPSYTFVSTADAFVLNPPYSANGNGMNFVEKALGMMNKGYAAIIIQSSAGSGKAKEYNKRILEKNTLLASIKMPIDLFIGKSSVQTNVYVFRVGEAHTKDDIVKFIDFSNDGYTRTNRKKASCNLRDTDHAKERYEEVVNLVRFGKKKLKYLADTDYYEGTIDPNNGADWNQSAPIDTKPTLQDFKKTVADYLAWEVSNLLKRQKVEEGGLGK